MKTPDRMRLALAALLLATAGQATAADYVQAPGSTLVFASNYQGETFTGRFGSFTTTMSFDPKQLATSKLDVAIQLAGTQTGNKDRDDTLVSADFFNVGKFAQPRQLLGYETYPDRSTASRAEYRIKQLSPQAKRHYAGTLNQPVPPVAITPPTSGDSHQR